MSERVATITGPDGREFTIDLPARDVYPRGLVVLVVIMSAVMVVPIGHWAFGLVRALSLYAFCGSMIGGSFARGRLSVFAEQRAVAETITKHYTLQPGDESST